MGNNTRNQIKNMIVILETKERPVGINPTHVTAVEPVDKEKTMVIVGERVYFVLKSFEETVAILNSNPIDIIFT